MVFLLLLPLYNRIAVFRANIAEKEKVIAESNYLIQKTDQWRDQISERETSIEKLNLALPSEKAIPDFIVSLRSLTGSSGVILNDIKIQADKRVSAGNKSNVEEFNVILEINGTYSAFKSWLDGLETNVRVADIQSINFEPIIDSGSSVLNFTVGLKVYYNK